MNGCMFWVRPAGWRHRKGKFGFGMGNCKDYATHVSYTQKSPGRSCLYLLLIVLLIVHIRHRYCYRYRTYQSQEITVPASLRDQGAFVSF